MKNVFKISVLFLFLGTSAWAQVVTSNHGNRFEQLERMLRDPSMYRSASGAPGPKYWQQRADYIIEATLNDENQRLDGYETITYYNNSPILWITCGWL